MGRKKKKYIFNLTDTPTYEKQDLIRESRDGPDQKERRDTEHDERAKRYTEKGAGHGKKKEYPSGQKRHCRGECREDGNLRAQRDAKYDKEKSSTKTESLRQYNSDVLTPNEIRIYRQIGEPIPGTDYLELFTDELVDWLNRIRKSDMPAHHKVAHMNQKGSMLQVLGFEELDVGTNVYAMHNAKYPGVVFKFAIDDYGIADNFNDVWLYRKLPDLCCKVFAVHPTGIVSVQERKVAFRKQERFATFIPQVKQILHRLEKEFVLVDIGLDKIRNYCINPDGTIGLVDASDIFPIPTEYNFFKCRDLVGTKGSGRHKKYVICGGKLEYDSIYGSLVCCKCGKSFNPSTIRLDKKEVRLMFPTNGMTEDEWDELNQMLAETYLNRKTTESENSDDDDQSFDDMEDEESSNSMSVLYSDESTIDSEIDEELIEDDSDEEDDGEDFDVSETMSILKDRFSKVDETMSAVTDHEEQLPNNTLPNTDDHSYKTETINGMDVLVYNREDKVSDTVDKSVPEPKTSITVNGSQILIDIHSDDPVEAMREVSICIRNDWFNPNSEHTLFIGPDKLADYMTRYLKQLNEQQ